MDICECCGKSVSRLCTVSVTSHTVQSLLDVQVGRRARKGVELFSGGGLCESCVQQVIEFVRVLWDSKGK